MDKMYSKREIDLKFRSMEDKNDAWNASILQKLDDLDKFRLTPTLTQVQVTNGRVTSLEGTRTWAKGVLYFLVPLFSVVSGWLVTQVVHLLQETSVLTIINNQSE